MLLPRRLPGTFPNCPVLRCWLCGVVVVWQCWNDWVARRLGWKTVQSFLAELRNMLHNAQLISVISFGYHKTLCQNEWAKLWISLVLQLLAMLFKESLNILTWLKSAEVSNFQYTKKEERGAKNKSLSLELDWYGTFLWCPVEVFLFFW